MAKDHSHSLTEAVRKQRETGDEAAAQTIFDRHVGRLVGLALQKLKKMGAKRKVVDEEDVALSALDTFLRHNRAGKYTITDRGALLALLLKITENKAIHAVRDQRAQKRDERRTRGDSDSVGADAREGSPREIAARQLTPDEEAEQAEQIALRISALPDSLRAIAVGYLQGYSVDDIAAQLDCDGESIKRRLSKIKKMWSGR